MSQAQSSQGLNLSQVRDMLNDFENNADVDDDEMLGSANDIDEALEKELDMMEVTNMSKTSADQAKRYAERFKAFLREHGLCDKIDSLVPQTLGKFLRYFYHSLLGKNGEFLAPASLGCVRAGIHRYLTSPPYNRPIDIIGDAQFQSANKMLKVLGALYLKHGGVTKSFPAIEPGDKDKIQRHFDR
jgi:hypothetical protein